MINADYRTLKQTVDELIKINRKKQSTLLLGIDGCGGSGKSTIARQLREDFQDVTIVHKDDFYLPSAHIMKTAPTEKPIGADYDWKRLLNEVLAPLNQDKTGYYQRYDWDSDCLAEWHTVPTGGIVIIEGVYTLRQELADYFDLKIWVDCPRDTRLARGLERDGEGARDWWEKNWMVQEDSYVAAYKPFGKADLILSGEA